LILAALREICYESRHVRLPRHANRSVSRMIGLALLLAATVPNAAPAQQFCVRAPGSEIVVCGTPQNGGEVPPPQQDVATSLPQGGYRLMNLRPRTYGPTAPGANGDRGNGIKVGAQVNNRGPARRKRSMATVGIPF
jgi:hypothetical protein